MSPIQNARYIFAEVPQGYPQPGKHTKYDTTNTIDLDNVSLDGAVLFKTLCLSIDPYMRGRMREANAPSYFPPFILGEPLDNFGVSVVVRSENTGFKAGDHAYGFFRFQEYNIVKDTTPFRILPNKENLPWTVYTGYAGMAGQTAYYGWKEYAQAKKGDIAYITAASGPVGSVVVQLAKADGVKVIASAGSDKKVEFLKSIGVDVAFNYKTTKILDVLEKEGPLNIYWDAVGGESLESALATAAKFARFIMCGTISEYNGESYPFKNLTNIFGKELRLNGFLVNTLAPKYSNEFYEVFPAKIASGEIKYIEHHTIGLEKVGQAILDVQQGANLGKSVVIVAEK